MAAMAKSSFLTSCAAVFLLLAGWAIPAAAQDAASVPLVLELDIPAREAAPAAMAKVTSTPKTVQLERRFLDRFDSFQPNGGTWRHHYNHNSYDSFDARTLRGNLEQQLYVDPGFKGTADVPLGLNPFEVSEGILHIKGQTAPPEHAAFLGGFDYTSGMLSSQNTFEQRYGYFEAHMRVPLGQGLWSAFWLKTHHAHTPKGLPAWPPEIDVMEFIGKGEDTYYVTVHWDVMPDNKKSGDTVKRARPTERFHTYGVLWLPDQTVFYLDRRPVRVIETKSNHDVPMFMVVNLGLGGRWPGKVSDAALPAQIELDWVAAYQVPGLD
jgi:beta-glucanase (GH16 family)